MGMVDPPATAGGTDFDPVFVNKMRVSALGCWSVAFALK